jgi:hypothetical protein
MLGAAGYSITLTQTSTPCPWGGGVLLVDALTAERSSPQKYINVGRTQAGPAATAAAE